jgi:hypothetical protein
VKEFFRRTADLFEARQGGWFVVGSVGDLLGFREQSRKGDPLIAVGEVCLLAWSLHSRQRGETDFVEFSSEYCVISVANSRYEYWERCYGKHVVIA